VLAQTFFLPFLFFFRVEVRGSVFRPVGFWLVLESSSIRRPLKRHATLLDSVGAGLGPTFASFFVFAGRLFGYLSSLLLEFLVVFFVRLLFV